MHWGFLQEFGLTCLLRCPNRFQETFLNNNNKYVVIFFLFLLLPNHTMGSFFFIFRSFLFHSLSFPDLLISLFRLFRELAGTLRRPAPRPDPPVLFCSSYNWKSEKRNRYGLCGLCEVRFLWNTTGFLLWWNSLIIGLILMSRNLYSYLILGGRGVQSPDDAQGIVFIVKLFSFLGKFKWFFLCSCVLLYISEP